MRLVCSPEEELHRVGFIFLKVRCYDSLIAAEIGFWHFSGTRFETAALCLCLAIGI